MADLEERLNERTYWRKTADNYSAENRELKATIERLQGEKEVFSESFKRNLRKGTEEVRAERDAAQSQLSSLTEELQDARKQNEDMLGAVGGCGICGLIAERHDHPTEREAALTEELTQVRAENERLKNG